MFLLNVGLDKSVVESLFFIRQYEHQGTIRRCHYVDRRIYPTEPFDAPVFTFVGCEPNTRDRYVLKISMGPRVRVSRAAAAEGGLRKLQINVEPDRKQVTPQVTLYFAKTGLPLTAEQLQELKQVRWGYECRLLGRPDQIIGYFYVMTGPSEGTCHRFLIEDFSDES
jgi:hypothetical protein